MEDSKAIRDLIKERARELGIELKDLSRRLGKNSGYLHDYCERGSPKTMPIEMKLQLANQLKIPPFRLGVSLAQFPRTRRDVDDVEPIDDADRFADLPANVSPFCVLTSVLDKSFPTPIVPGMILIANTDVDPEKLVRGSIVIANAYQRDNATPYAIVLREYVPPGFLVTTSSGPNEIMALDDPENEFRFEIIAVVQHHVISLSR